VIRGTALAVADRVDASDCIGQSHLGIKALSELDQLSVNRGSGVADDLHVPLAELTVTTSLRSVVPEHGADERQPQRPRPHVHAVLDEGAHDPGRRLGAQGPRRGFLLAALGAGNPEHLLLDGVRGLSQTAGEELNALEKRDLDALECVSAR
jgi:hypothetical protein